MQIAALVSAGLALPTGIIILHQHHARGPDGRFERMSRMWSEFAEFGVERLFDSNGEQFLDQRSR
jgi:hypothetical protein